jgi:hypothetical protein
VCTVQREFRNRENLQTQYPLLLSCLSKKCRNMRERERERERERGGG